jgi:hypothetical protein
MKEMLADILKLFKVAVLIVKVMSRLMKWKDNHDWYISKDLKGGGHKLFPGILLELLEKISNVTCSDSNPDEIPIWYFPDASPVHYAHQPVRY